MRKNIPTTRFLHSNARSADQSRSDTTKLLLPLDWSRAQKSFSAVSYLLWVGLRATALRTIQTRNQTALFFPPRDARIIPQFYLLLQPPPREFCSSLGLSGCNFILSTMQTITKTEASHLPIEGVA